MCQTGAFAMARRGYGYREILAHYYTGVTIARLAPAAP
jgi:SpoIID/LytB domain protein